MPTQKILKKGSRFRSKSGKSWKVDSKTRTLKNGAKAAFMKSGKTRRFIIYRGASKAYMNKIRR